MVRTLPGRLTGASERSGLCCCLRELGVCSPQLCVWPGCAPILSVASEAVLGLLPPLISQTVKYSSRHFPSLLSHWGSRVSPL